jgi:hypothetical protein
VIADKLSAVGAVHYFKGRGGCRFEIGVVG